LNERTIVSCYSIGDVNATGVNDRYIGGFGGGNGGIETDSNIVDCYSTGAVVGTYDVGGFLGYNYGGSIINCLWNTQTSGLATSDGGMGKTTVEMKTFLTFTSGGWDFVDTWGIGNGQTYPYLKIFNGINAADLNYSGKVDLVDLGILADNWLSSE
jgi:hypothetical protein